MIGFVLSAAFLAAVVYLCRRAYVRGSHSALTSALACTCAMASVLMPAMGARTTSNIIYLVTGGAVAVAMSWGLAWVHSARYRAATALARGGSGTTLNATAQAESSAALAHVLKGVGSGFLQGIAFALVVYATGHI